MRSLIMFLLLLVIAALPAGGHFSFVVAQPDGRTAKVILSETLEIDTQVGG